MKQHIGADIIEIARIEEAIARWGERFLKRVYTKAELTLYHRKPPSLAARFAGKEAAIKALNPDAGSIGWKEVEILSEPGGRPAIKLHGRAKRQAESLGLSRLDISLSHSREYAIAFVSGITE